MQIIEKKIIEIRPYENNPRRNDDSVEVVAKSIEEFGFKVPIVITADGEIVCGHTRYKAALQLNLETVPCVIADDLSPEQIKAFRLVDNKTSELSTWDIPKLDMELYSLSDFNLKEFSFNVKDESEAEEDMDIDDFFEEVESTPEPSKELSPDHKKTKQVTCPHCNEVFEIEL